MNVGNIARRLTGAAKNAVVWGVTWTALAFATVMGMRALGVPGPAEVGVLDALGMAVRVGIVGGVAGGAFAAFVSLFYRGRRLSEISPVRFGLGGALVSEAFMIAFFTLPSLLSGNGLPSLQHIRGDLIFPAVFGGIAAGASMWLAQRADTLPRPTGDAPGRLGAGDPLASTGTRDARQPQPLDRRA